MDHLQPQTITQLLLDWRNGEPAALDKLLPLVYGELHKRAKARMKRERPGHMLQATALINEVFDRLLRKNQIDWKSRDHFFALCNKMMWQILNDWYWQEKPSDGDEPIDSKTQLIPDAQKKYLSRLNDALEDLVKLHPRQGQVVKLHIFVGLNIKEVAIELRLSPETIKKDWRMAKAFLLRELSHGTPHDT